MGLKEYPRLNLKRAFWRWYLTTTDTGESLFQKVSDNIVLYTHANKENTYYRFFKKAKGRRRKVNPKIKRLTMILCLYTKIFFNRQVREAFEMIKYNGKPQKQIAIENIIDRTNDRKTNGFRHWLKRMRDIQI
jgi:hypothetical protein